MKSADQMVEWLGIHIFNVQTGSLISAGRLRFMHMQPQHFYGLPIKCGFINSCLVYCYGSYSCICITYLLNEYGMYLLQSCRTCVVIRFYLKLGVTWLNCAMG